MIGANRVERDQENVGLGRGDNGDNGDNGNGEDGGNGNGGDGDNGITQSNEETEKYRPFLLC
jgi:hypothetical protein